MYEKSIILKYVNEHNKDPVDGSDLAPDDLIPLKLGTQQCSVFDHPFLITALLNIQSAYFCTVPSIARPRPPSANSVPNILTSLQSEWDTTMLEMFQLRQQYNNVRSELSNALYELDAAKRVIARIIRERDSALKVLSEQKSSTPEESTE